MSTKISSLIENQLPEFIRNDYGTFVSFMEAYYSWMEEEGNPLNRSAKLLQSLDVDTSLTAFIEYFCNKFIPLIPQHLLSNKEFLIAHAKEFYRNKGNENSFKLLFKLIFNEDIQLYYPKDDILRVSDGTRIS